MDTDAVISQLGVRADTLTRNEIDALDQEGWVAFREILTHATVSQILSAIESRFRIRTFAEGRDGGTVHLKELHELPEIDVIWKQPKLLAGVRHILGSEMRIRAVHYRAPRPGFGAQALHADWGHAIRPGDWQVCTALVALTKIDARTAPTRVVPGSHRDGRRIVYESPDEHDPNEVLLTAEPGTIFLFNGHILHSGTQNQGTDSRHAVLINFGRGSTTMNIGPSDSTLDRFGDAAWLWF